MSATNTNPLVALRQDHVVVLEHLDRMEKACRQLARGGGSHFEEAIVSLKGTAAFFVNELEAHLRKEEDVLFPSLEAVIGAEGGPTAVMRQEHQDLRNKNWEFQIWVADLDDGTNESVNQVQKLSTYMTGLLREHIHKEDYILFSIAEEALDASVLARMGQQMQAL
ncbi:MAG: hemerythrin domain-containing protein [Chloroflexi bacterium]|nr:hemerythrin domain-containing protein [Chloroflexota bacterium]